MRPSGCSLTSESFRPGVAERFKVGEATVELRSSGYAEIVVRSFRGPYKFVGSWRPGSGKQVAMHQATRSPGARCVTSAPTRVTRTRSARTHVCHLVRN